MNFFDWEFSKEVQLELNKFLKVVSQSKNGKYRLENEIREIIPELQTLHDDLEETRDQIKNQNLSVINEEIINLSDDETDLILNEIKTELPDISLLNLTQAAIKQQKDEVLDENVQDFIQYLLECLVDDNFTAENVNISKLVNDFNTLSLNYIFTQLFEISDDGVYNLNKLLCNRSNASLKNIPELFCKHILFPKLQSVEPTDKILNTMKEFCETFPEQIKQELLVLLFTLDSESVESFNRIFNLLGTSEKQNLIKDFVNAASEIESTQIPILEYLFSSKVDDIVMRRLINLMSVSADKFKTENMFMKLICVVINNLESEFEDQAHVIFGMIEKSKTAHKFLAQKAFKKWSSKFNVQ